MASDRFKTLPSKPETGSGEMKVKCAFCGKMVEEDDVKFRLTVGGETLSFCSFDCLFKSEPLKEVRHISLSSLVLNKTVFEFLAIVMGLGGVYYTLFEAGSNALMMDTISVMAAIAVMIVGVEHLKYVEEHRLVGRAVLLLGAIILLSILLFVWLHGFS